MDSSIIIAIAFCILFSLMFLGIPIGVSFFIAGITGISLTRGFPTGLALLGSGIYSWANVDAFVTLALFVLMGFFAFWSGISGELYDGARKFIGRFRGGLAQATILACTGFAACTGSSVAGAATMGTIAFPEMEKLNYSRRLSTGAIAAGGTLGILIPPSTSFIIYGYLTMTSIADLFIAGFIPGLLLSLIFITQIAITCKMNPNMGPAGPSYPRREMLISIKGIWSMLLLLIVVIGSLYFGICTPSEAGAVGALGALIIALTKRNIGISGIISSLKDTVKIACYVVTIAIGAMAFNTFLATSGAQTMFTQWVGSLPVSRYVILIPVLLLYLPLGMILDTLGMTMLTIPILFPIIVGLGFDPIWFGIVTTILMEMALISPPIAMNIYVVQGVTKVPFSEISRGIIPFYISMIICVAILVAFPDIVLFLPNTMRALR